MSQVTRFEATVTIDSRVARFTVPLNGGGAPVDIPPDRSFGVLLPTDFPAGATVDVTLEAHDAAGLVATGTGHGNLTGNRTVLTVDLAPTAAIDGGLVDLAGSDGTAPPDLTAPPPDLFGVDLFGADLTPPPPDLSLVPDLSVVQDLAGVVQDLAKVPDLRPVDLTAVPVAGVWDVTSWDNCVWN